MSSFNPSVESAFFYHFISGSIHSEGMWETIADWLDLPTSYRGIPVIVPASEELFAEIVECRNPTYSVDFYQLGDITRIIEMGLTKRQQNNLLELLKSKNLEKLKGELK